MNNCPLISCICVTRGKPQLLRRSILCFETQTYLNRELIIVYEEDDLQTAEFLRHRTDWANVRIVVVKAIPKHSLGSLRNIGIAMAIGNFICQWDDDDWYHVRRLELQLNALSGTGKKASILKQWLVFDECSCNAYISNKRLWEGSVLCDWATIRQKPYEPIGRGEDTPVIDYLKENHWLHEIESKAGMYIYVYHGSNTWSEGHWNYIFDCSQKLTAENSQEVRDILNGKYTNAEASDRIDQIWRLQ